MIKIAHEAPISILQDVQSMTDYDYGLVHLMDTEPAYLDFFMKAREKGRYVILDNSIFELGEAYSGIKYVQWINKIRPSAYIIPDVLEDCDGTIDSATDFTYDCMTSIDYKAQSIGVVQGKTYGELVKCYTAMDTSVRVDKIAISFDYSYYQEVFPHPNKWVSFMMGRVLTLNRMLLEGVINVTKPHHLLGCAHPREFGFYAHPEFSWIDTLDTSSPVVHGLKGITGSSYSFPIGSWQKESTKLVDLLHTVPTREQAYAISNNISLFRQFIK